ncbi:MAG: transposase, partial [Cyanobacteria bacterium RM1_2_2]|nr:transposase [Cyanobacteria bacterium RM1_2_2]
VAPSERSHQIRNQRHKTMLDRARQMLTQVRRWIPHRAIVRVADSSFAALEFLDALRQLPTTISVITRLRLDAALYEPAPERQAKQMGRPRKVGQRLATLKARLDAPETTWQTITIEGWYGGRTYDLQIISDTAVWYHTGLPAVPMRWVLVKDPNRQTRTSSLSLNRHPGYG